MIMFVHLTCSWLKIFFSLSVTLMTDLLIFDCWIIFLIFRSKNASHAVITRLFPKLLGRIEVFKHEVTCHHCETKSDPFHLKQFLVSGYWPLSPTATSYIVDVEVFKLWDALRKRAPGLSENSFLQSLGDLLVSQNRVGWSENIFIKTVEIRYTNSKSHIDE